MRFDPDYDSDRRRLADLIRDICRHVGVLQFSAKRFAVESCAVLVDPERNCDYVLCPWRPQADGTSVRLPDVEVAKIIQMRPDRLEVIDTRGRTFVFEPLSLRHGQLFALIQRWRAQQVPAA